MLIIFKVYIIALPILNIAPLAPYYYLLSA